MSKNGFVEKRISFCFPWSVSGGEITTAIEEALQTFQERAIQMGINVRIEKDATMTEMEAKMVSIAKMEIIVLITTKKVTISTSMTVNDYQLQNLENMICLN